jgi:ribose/xylose/arabinose/galactoside ABC-type transport system permease subunit
MTRRSLITGRNLPILITLMLFIIMFGLGSVAFTGFFSLQNLLNLFIDNAYLLILAVGMTFVIVSGGIDLSVGSVLALATMVSSSLVEKSHMNPVLVIAIVLAMGTALGFFMGWLIQAFNLPPFIITLAGLYFARGMCYVVSIDTIAITNPFWKVMAESRINLIGDSSLSPSAIIAIVVVIAAMFMSRYTKFGRALFAVGGNEQSALLMGLPVRSTKIAVYALSGFCSALGGIVFTFYTLSGYALNGKGMELDTIATVVIGGTLLTGGAGTIIGTVLGVFVYGIIYTLITFQSLNPWWTRIVIGFLIFVFCALQRLFERGKKTVKTARTAEQAAAEAAHG